MIRATRILNIRRIRRQPLRAFIAVVAVGAGVSLAVAILILSSSTAASLSAFDNRLAGPAAFRVVGATSRGGLEQAVLGQVRAVQGVAAAVPVVEAVTYVEDGARHEVPVVAFGVDCSIQQLVGEFGCSPAALAAHSPPVLSGALAAHLGRGSVLRSDVGRTSLDGAPSLAGLDRLNRGRVVVLALPAAQALFDRVGRLDAIYVVATRSADLHILRGRLTRAVGGWNGVVRAASPPAGVGVVAAAFVPLFSLLGVFALGIGAVLIYNTMTLTLEERRKDLAILGAVGAPASTVIGGTLIEAGCLGLIGGVVGVAGGFVVAHPLTRSVSTFTTNFAGVPTHVHVTAASFVAGVVLGAVVGIGAAWLPARRATRMDVAAELSSRGTRSESSPRTGLRRAAFAGVVALAGMVMCWLAQRGGGLQPWQAAVAPIGVGIASIGLLFTVGTTANLLLGVVHTAGGGRGRGSMRLALANLVRDPARTSVMAVAAGAAVAVAFLVASSHRSVHDAIAHGVASGNPREVQIRTLSSSNTLNVDAKPSDRLIKRLGAIPGVAHIDHGAAVLTGHGTADLVGATASDYPSLNFPVVAGAADRTRFEAGEVLIGATLARTHHLRPGSMVTLPTPTGFAGVRVQGVVLDGNFNGRVVEMSMPLLLHLFGPQPSGAVGLIADDATTPDVLAARVRALHLDPDLVAETPKQTVAEASRAVGQQLSAFDALQRALLLVAFIAVLSTLLLVGVQRRRELGLLAAVGMEPGQLAAMTVLEAVIIGVTGVGLAVFAAVAMDIALTEVLPIIIGFKDPIRYAFSSTIVAGPVTVAVVVAAAGLPAWRSARIEVLEALQYE